MLYENKLCSPSVEENSQTMYLNAVLSWVDELEGDGAYIYNLTDPINFFGTGAIIKGLE